MDTLVLLREGDWHALWVSWLPSGEHWGWYVNLQLPFRRTELGFETMDLVLDLIVDPDGSWRWKDEDELETWVARGVCEPELAERIRAEGESVLARAPWPTGWEEWRPDPGLGAAGASRRLGRPSVSAHHGGRAGEECEHDRGRHSRPMRGSRQTSTPATTAAAASKNIQAGCTAPSSA